MLSLPIECAYMRAHTLGSERIKVLEALEALGALEALESLESLESLENLEKPPEVESERLRKCKMQNAKCRINKFFPEGEIGGD